MPLNLVFPSNINIILISILLISIYILYKDYKYENETDFITDCKDFENNTNKYENSNLYHLYSNINDNDKVFINDYINYINIKYKKEKPAFYKKINRIRNQVLFASIASILVAKSSIGFLESLKKNYIQFFIMSGII
jgi:hypothetical protein